MTVIKAHRQAYRSFFNCPLGIEFLHEVVIGSKIFEAVDPTDVAAVAGRNFALSLMDTLGVFDEEKIDQILKLALSCEDMEGAFENIEESTVDEY